MAKKGLIFIQNEYPKDGESYICKKKYRFIPKFGASIRTIIELDLYKNNICVISFYEHNKGTNKTKYRVRSNLGAGHTRAIFSACLEAYYGLKEDYALVFYASNDIGKKKEDNSRYSAYLLFLSMYFKKYDEYDRQGSIALNTFMLYHRTFQYKEEANIFYDNFENDVKANLDDEDEDSEK